MLNTVRWNIGTKDVSGTTLMEHIAAIAIVTVVAAILMPVLSVTRQTARRNACASNEMRLAEAIGQYAQDSDGYLPISNDFGDPTMIGWGNLIFPYVKDVSIYHCPEFPDANDNIEVAVEPSVTYNYNSMLG